MSPKSQHKTCFYASLQNHSPYALVTFSLNLFYSFILSSLHEKDLLSKPNPKTHSTPLVLSHPTQQNVKPPATKLKKKAKEENWLKIGKIKINQPKK